MISKRAVYFKPKWYQFWLKEAERLPGKYVAMSADGKFVESKDTTNWTMRETKDNSSSWVSLLYLPGPYKDEVHK